MPLYLIIFHLTSRGGPLVLLCLNETSEEETYLSHKGKKTARRVDACRAGSPASPGCSHNRRLLVREAV